MQNIILALVICMAGGVSDYLPWRDHDPAGTAGLDSTYREELNNWWKENPPQHEDERKELTKRLEVAYRVQNTAEQQRIFAEQDKLEKQIKKEEKAITDFNQHVERVLQAIQNPIPQRNSPVSSVDDQFVADLHACGFAYIPWMKLSGPVKDLLQYQIPTNSSPQYFQKVKEKKAELLNEIGLEGVTLDGVTKDQPVLDALNTKRRRACRAWFTQQNPDKNKPEEDFGFVRTVAFQDGITVSSYQGQILKYFVDSEDTTEGDQKCAQVLNDWMNKRGVKAFNEKDCQQRPWYVVGCFFELVSVGRFKEPDMQKFLPLRGELEFPLSELRQNDFEPKVIKAIQQWLDLKFAVESEQTEGKSLEELLEVLDQQLQAVRPYHRYLKQQYEQKGQSKEASFLERFILERP